MEHPLSDFHGELSYRNAKSPAFPREGRAFQATVLRL
jgi:hypothetical protein